MLANRLEIYRHGLFWRDGRVQLKIWHQDLTVRLTVQRFRFPALVADRPRKLSKRSKQETDCQSTHREGLKRFAALLPVVLEKPPTLKNQPPSLPLNRRRRLAADVIGHPVDAAHLVDDAA